MKQCETRMFVTSILSKFHSLVFNNKFSICFFVSELVDVVCLSLDRK